MDDALLAEVRADADAEGLTLSGWLAHAASDRLRLKALRQLVEEWEGEHGAITAAELDALQEQITEARRAATRRDRPAQASAGGRAAA